MIDSKEKKPLKDAFQLKGSILTVSVLHLYDKDLMRLENELAKLVKKTPKLFANMPIVIDISQASGSIDFPSLKQKIRQTGLIPIGLRGGNPIQQQLAELAGLGVLSESKAESRPVKFDTKSDINKTKEFYESAVGKEEPAATKVATRNEVKPATKQKAPTIVITQPVRSGQQVFAKDGDLVIVAPVSPGAEVLAEGNIHIYGALRGRALAGVSGDTNARIFCHSMEAQLISIAGIYLVSEQLTPIKKHTQVYLEEEHLKIKAFK